MTGPNGNNEFCFPETLNVSRGEAERNIEVEARQNSLFPAGPVIECFVIPPNSKQEKTAKKSFALLRWLTNVPRFQGARPTELVSFDHRHVTHSPPIGKRI